MPNNAILAALYQTKNTRISFTSNVVVQVLNSDPTRIYVRFVNGNGGATLQQCYPGPLTSTTVGSGAAPSPIEAKFKDGPSMVTGEWYCSGVLGQSILITEVLYLGD